ncbi:hypothetical protein MLD38_030840 [Melastoma candidum]|uniref:Uncharacterized protein n=1 Tax=Melastoma candidum TaxID=119954 RepID=A0ACB9MMX4_9MYRT|nr:hypothetical protein MLD38_030840 [Melastoma candidum]
MLSAVSRSTCENVDRDCPQVAPFTPSGQARPHHRQPSYCTYYQDRYYGEAVADCIEFIKKTASSDEDDDCRSVAAADMVVSVQVA